MHNAKYLVAFAWKEGGTVAFFTNIEDDEDAIAAYIVENELDEEDGIEVLLDYILEDSILRVKMPDVQIIT